MQPTKSNSDSQPIFPYNVHNQLGFENLLFNRRGFISCDISKKYLQEFKVAYQ